MWIPCFVRLNKICMYIWNSWWGPGPINDNRWWELIHYLFLPLFSHFFLAPILHLIFFSDNTDSLFALFLILVHPIHVWDVFNVTNVTTLLFDGEIDGPKIGNSSETFYNQCITPERFSSYKHDKMCILKDKYLPNTSKFELFYSPSKDSAYHLKYNNSIDSFLFIWESSFSPQNWNNTQ